MTRRDRLEDKLQQRQEWAEKATTRATTHFATAGRIADGIPFGQPILIGHHSERHARADAERIRGNMDKGVEEARLARHHDRKADGLVRQLATNIFSDDADAITALEARIAEREAEAAGYVALNAAWRKAKGDLTRFAELAGIDPSAAATIAQRVAEAYSWEKQPIPAYMLSNLRATIRRDKERIAEIETRTARTEQAEAAGGVTIEQTTGGYCRITFAEKPDRAILDALRAAGYRWSGGTWRGAIDQLPSELRVDSSE